MAISVNNGNKDRSSEIIKYSQKKENYKEIVETCFSKLRAEKRGYWSREDIIITYDMANKKFVMRDEAPLLNSILTSKIEFNRVRKRKVIEAYEYLVRHSNKHNSYEENFEVMLEYVYSSLKNKIKNSMKEYNKAVLINEYPPHYEMVLDDFSPDRWLNIWKMYLNQQSYRFRRTEDAEKSTIELINNDRLVLYKNVDDLIQILLFFRRRSIKMDGVSKILNESFIKIINEYKKYGNEVLISMEELLEFYISRTPSLHSTKGELSKTINRIKDIAINSDYVFKPKNLSVFNINSLLYKTDLESFLMFRDDNFAGVELYITIGENISHELALKLLSGIFINPDNGSDIMIGYSFPTKYGRDQRTYNLTNLKVSLSSDIYNHIKMFVDKIIDIYNDDEKQLLLKKLSLIQSLTNDVDESKYDSIKDPCR